MKKIILSFIVVVVFGATNMASAQDCSAIVRPLCIQRNIDTSTYPAEKLELFCSYSRNIFFFTQQVPEGANVHDIWELTDYMTGEKLPRTFVPDLNTFSYWGYNFEQFRPNSSMEYVYFRMGEGSETQYLGVRPYGEAQYRTHYPEKYKN